jgi:hypothetical protein
LMNMTAASSASPGVAQNVAVPAAAATSVRANRRRSGARQALDPYHKPAGRAAQGVPPRMSPASGLCPCLAAKPTVARSIAASIAPKKR